MKGSKAIRDALNGLLKSEFTAIHRYVAESRMLKNHGYNPLAKATMNRALSEMCHAKRLMSRIALLEGDIVADAVESIELEAGPADIVDNDATLERRAISLYQEAISLCCEDPGDPDTRRMLEEILEDETEHLQYIEALQAQVIEMGLQNWLSTQV